ncbi:unnamed protein product [Strongylus vulgaris]|uniref:Lin-15A/B-like domain-containing protein n=1 Tax=Strongylus vulgaris TaxID=40348 RepID=A0A3P7KGE1_STRVU|nr:unnamed protein product [Strongylus vulgaris]
MSAKNTRKKPCYLCGQREKQGALRRTSRKNDHTAVLLSTLVIVNKVDFETAKKRYESLIKVRRHICYHHFVDAAQFIATELASLGIGFTSLTDESNGQLVLYVNETDIPLHLVDRINENAKNFDVDMTVTAKSVCEYLNFCLSRYRVGGIRLPPKQEDAAKKKHQKATFDTAPVVLSGEEPSTSEGNDVSSA